MKLSEVFSQLAYGELSQLGLCSNTLGSINPANYGQVVAHTNLGLTALYSRFALKHNRTGFVLQNGVYTYALDTSGDTEFIEVDGEFNDDVLKIETVSTAEGYSLPLNDSIKEYNCITPSALVLRVPVDIVDKDVSLPSSMLTDALIVGYRAKHPEIKFSSSFNPGKVDLELPTSYLQALLYFIASRVHNPIGMTNEFHAGNSYAAKYEKACEMLEMKNLQVDQGNQSDRLIRNGWV